MADDHELPPIPIGSNKQVQIGDGPVDLEGLSNRFMTLAELESLGLTDAIIQSEYERTIGSLDQPLVGALDTLQTKCLRARVYDACCARWYAGEDK